MKYACILGEFFQTLSFWEGMLRETSALWFFPNCSVNVLRFVLRAITVQTQIGLQHVFGEVVTETVDKDPRGNGGPPIHQNGHA
jgi:hypothetical protein